MRFSVLALTTAALLIGSTAEAAIITFNTDPFAGTTALTTPGRQIVPPAGSEMFISFDPENDVFVFNPAVFGLTDPLSFASGPAGSIPITGPDVVVLQEFGPPMAAGIAASLIAARVTTPGPGVFVYFNTGLGVPRLVYSTNLDDETADLAVLARLTNLNASSMTAFGADNFDVPEPGALALFGLTLIAALRRRSR
jgi:hypothetical protein